MTLLSEIKRLILLRPDPKDEGDDTGLRKDERDSAILSGKCPPDAAEIERLSEYRLSSLVQFPHY